METVLAALCWGSGNSGSCDELHEDTVDSRGSNLLLGRVVKNRVPSNHSCLSLVVSIASNIKARVFHVLY